MTTKPNAASASPPRPHAGDVRSPLPNVVSSTKQGAEGSRKPARLWRNRWRSNVAITTKSGEVNGPGEFCTTNTHPTAEIAEQKARELIDGFCQRKIASIGLRYLGPVPAGDA